jgi:hypothetical protein
VFPELFSIVRCKEASVADCVQFSNEIFHFSIPVHDREVESVTSFFNLLYSLRLRRGGADKIY